MVLLLGKAATASDTSRLLRDLVATMCTIPRCVVTDGGGEFKGLFKTTADELRIQHIVIPPYSQWLNGLAERFHRTFETRIRASVLEKSSYGIQDVAREATRAVMGYNISYHSGIRRSPHSVVFTFQAWIFPALKAYRPTGEEDMFPVLEDFVEVARENAESDSPQPGEVWYLKNRRQQLKAMDPRYIPCVVLKRDGRFTYVVKEKALVTRVTRGDLERYPPTDKSLIEQVEPDQLRLSTERNDPGGTEVMASPESHAVPELFPQRMAGKRMRNC